jgi:hypothetical protein
VSFKIEEDISAALAATLMLKEANKAKDEGWEEVTMKIQTFPDKFAIALYGIKK